jgi:hypothetical protein
LSGWRRHLIAGGPEGGLARRDARTILAAAPTPAQAAKVTPTRLRRLLIKAGRKRYLERDAERLREIFTDTYLHQLPQVETAMGAEIPVAEPSEQYAASHVQSWNERLTTIR